jgi:hypothetical protein
MLYSGRRQTAKGWVGSMVPLEFTTFFSVMAGVGGTLFGLIFVAITIRPEAASDDSSSQLRPFQIASSYTALLNPLVISLLALVPHATIGTVTIVMSSIGLINSCLIGIHLVQVSMWWTNKVGGVFFILVSLLLYGFEIYCAIRLTTTPHDPQALYNLTTLLVIIYLYGIARAWDLVGARQFHIGDLLAPLVPQRVRERIFAPSQKSSSQKLED